jgi:cobaltochelatase CobS
MASTTTAARENVSGMPDIKVSARQLFGIDTDMEVPAFSQATEHVPEVDDAYLSDSGRRWRSLQASLTTDGSAVQGYHGTGKSTHIEQVAARLNWPCLRQPRQPHLAYRPDRQGRDRCATASRSPSSAKASSPWALQNPTALV